MSPDKDKVEVTTVALDNFQKGVRGLSDDAGIPVRYRGTEVDKRDMQILGKQQVLRRNFKFITMLGFASTVVASWELLLPLFTFVLTDGGRADLFWGFIVCACGMSLVYASIAEMASMCPTAGGQYHWVSEFAPPRFQKFLSYIVGWLCAIGWQVYLAGVCFMVGTIIQGLIALNVTDYVWHNWHGTLLTIAVIAFSIAFNTVLATRLPLIEGTILILHLAGFFAIIIPLWIMAPRAHPLVLLEFSNNGGWSNTGLSAMIGLISPMSVLIGYDCSVHMSEEIRDASISLPKAIMWSVILNAILGFLMAVTLIFTLGDIDSILATPTFQPFIQVFFNATGSYAATNTMTVIVIILLESCCISEVATASRQIWSFARDYGLPGSGWLSQVMTGWNIPLRTVCVSLVISCLLSCINLGSSTALNAINSLGGIAILSSYFITISCLIWRRVSGQPLPPRRWSLGRYGLYINIAALSFLTPIWVFAFWPLATPVTAATMNWSSTMFGGVLVFALIYYVVKGRYEYVGPVLQVKRDESFWF
ncbi:amino acid/polyamine transporter I [Xylogone sp. PMI_703]|nr:amino acid/polyamine transporter I [Xylogone sp. PMI_703]